MIKESLLFACVIGTCFSAAITNIQPESESNVVDNAVEEVDGNGASDLDSAESKHHGFGPRVVVIHKVHGGYHGGGHHSGCLCGGNSHYHSHYRYYGKKK